LEDRRTARKRHRLCRHALCQRICDRVARGRAAAPGRLELPGRKCGLAAGDPEGCRPSGRCSRWAQPTGRWPQAMKMNRSLVIGLDIGTSKVVALVGEAGADGAIEVLGIGSQPSRGLKKGVVVNIESTVQSIQRAVEEAELMAGCEIHSVYAGIAG